MRKNPVKQALAEGKLQLGTGFGQLRSPEIPKILAAAGFHWAFLDTEHGGFDLETVQDICRVSVMVGLAPIVRVADLQYSLVARALDCGAQGIIFPRVESAELLERAISWTKFPPLGIRGYGLSGVNLDYEKVDFPQVIEHMNANTMVVMQIETRRALDMREELLSVPGIDAVMVGPADLSISLGVPGEFQHPTMVKAMEDIRDTCIRRGIAPGTQTRSAPQAKFWKDRGMRFLGCSNDTGMLFDRASELAAQLSAA
ncbi:MAG TPA: aldolase/citrate lyase family protein [Bryobacteraceae bacterium]|jgi:2-keto-3-deoxy-L-rhamnonate aldolase RhmA|nr:aldolase/citrate lyase family protein [Bryobacteraceae bacterium]